MSIISGAGVIVGAVVVKVIADDAKEWTPWVTRRLLDIAVRRLPEVQRERYAEEWAAHLAEVPSVVGKLALSLQFQIAAFGARELDARARLDAWRNEQLVALAEVRVSMRALVVEALIKRGPTDEADEDVFEEHLHQTLININRRCDEIETSRPALGISVVGAIFIAGCIFSKVRKTTRAVVTLQAKDIRPGSKRVRS